jgi:DNA-binding transcriptional ArsR family regulator
MKEPLEALADVTRLKILGILSEGKLLTNTELYKLLKTDGVVYRESVFKALKKLLAQNLIKREFKEKRGYEYSLNFREIRIGRKLKLKVE